ncbi:NAD(P)-binding protein [Fomitopsis serialis]|uniref:NAD(P)-binding protein n=1 Tax=Fomitopsis serialis TaxID=139415 RepID=UPI00200817C6|nr:NAD(P)-binding protein [Neoantrodia serialis]KAH9926740.1 NAD(P)-binding protein [Neoantrodia serialis]
MGSLASPKRVAVVTGAAQGIGRCIAMRLAADGLDVAVNDLPTKLAQLEAIATEIKSLTGCQAIVVTGDVSRDEDVEAMVASVVEGLGGLDVMVANAGITEFRSLVDLDVKEWDRNMAINARGVMLCYKYAAKQMIEQGRGGRIIGIPSLSAYAASKFAVRGLTQCAALELAAHKITVNAYAPGAIRTNIVNNEEDMREDERLGLPPGTTTMKRLNMPMNIPMADPEVIGSLVSYIAKPESHFITGQTISANGGTHCD